MQLLLRSLLAGALLEQAEALLDKGIHPIKIANGFDLACKKALDTLDDVSDVFPIEKREMLLQSAITSLASKPVSGIDEHPAALIVAAIEICICKKF
uniref:Uncharacterized protein n=1 Tax=Parascaris equorum TaxID=6256 RepID=A0A914R608_PAREQ